MNHFVKSKNILQSFKAPLFLGIKDEKYRNELIIASDEIGELHKYFSNKIPNILNLSLGFNSLDGD